MSEQRLEHLCIGYFEEAGQRTVCVPHKEIM
jgi:hypothetical protein